ncbi:MAG: hypothetical protein DRN07_07235 [Thermoplasmata archaeon]|nr:MAG: hypothetical protein DRN07_07235 [Thermoplasmata archaeon]
MSPGTTKGIEMIKKILRHGIKIKKSDGILVFRKEMPGGNTYKLISGKDERGRYIHRIYINDKLADVKRLKYKALKLIWSLIKEEEEYLKQKKLNDFVGD